MVLPDTVENIRRRLEAERAELQSQIDAFPIENENQKTDYGAGQHPADDATELFLRERNIPLRSNSQDIIDQIDLALQRIDEGNYGLCMRCGQSIQPERLQAIPYASLCITCQSVVEQET